MGQAILLMAYGGPDSLADIAPYLQDIRGGRPTSPELLAEIQGRYAQIGGRSPLLEITCAQASALEEQLNQLAPATDGAPAFKVYVGMRHWKPYIRDSVAQIAADGYQRGIAVCMAPHASKMSSGAYLQKLQEALAGLKTPLQMDFIESWHDQPFLIQSLAENVRMAAQQFPEQERPRIHYLFTAHSLPASLMEQGDPYAIQLQETTRLLAQALGLAPEQWSFAYQSAGSIPGRWLGPQIGEVLPDLAQAGKRQVLVTPVGFIADHVEILYDLDIEAQRIAQTQGIHLVRSASMNATPGFIHGFARFILERSKAVQGLDQATRLES
jgi:ferrochelatase